MTVTLRDGFWIAEGWVSIAELYTNGYEVKNLPSQSDMSNGRRWIRPGNTADIIQPAKFVESPVGLRWGYGGLVFSWPMQSLSPKMVDYLQTTFFSPNTTPTNFFQRAWFNKITCQTYNRASGEFEAYQCWARFASFLNEAEPAMGGYNNLQIQFTAFGLAPDGPDINAEVTIPSPLYDGINFTFSAVPQNVGDSVTVGDTYFYYSIPTGFDFVQVSIPAGVTEYSDDNGVTYSETPPVDLTTVTDLRILYAPTINASTSGTSIDITLTPNSVGTFPTTTTWNAEVDENPANDSDTSNIIVSAFTPNSIANLWLWLDANEDVYSDGLETPAINNDPVYDWFDQSANGYDAEQPTALLRPIYKTGQANGKSALQFAGAEYMDVLNIINDNDTFEMFAFFVVDPTNDGAAAAAPEILLEVSDNDVSKQTWSHIADEGTFDNVGMFNSVDLNVYDTALNTLQIYTFQNSESSGNKFYRNLTLVDTGTAVDPTLGNDGRVGASIGVASDFYSGLIYEIVVYRGTELTTQQRERVINYLKTKYGI